jgi:hypothetical protein
MFLRIKEIPIPYTGVLQFTGDKFVHGPLNQVAPSPGEIIAQREQAFVNWFEEAEFGAFTRTFNGTIDFGGKGIGTLIGALPKINDVLGYDVFANDFNIDLVGATYQDQIGGLEHESFLRLGGELRVPILANLFGEKIARFIPATPKPTNFLYLNISSSLENWSLLIEGSADINIPVIGTVEYSESYFLLNKDGLTTEGKMTLPNFGGLFEFDKKFKGRIWPEGFEFEYDYTKDIFLPNGINIKSTNLKVRVSNVKGLYLEGDIELPFGVTKAYVLAILNSQKILFEGSFTQEMDLGYGFSLPSKDMYFKFSNDPAEGISYNGTMTIPHVGDNHVDGLVNQTTFEFNGTMDRTLSFKNVQLPIANGNLKLNPQAIALQGMVTLPFGLKKAQLSGTITDQVMVMKGTMASSIDVGGYAFNFGNSYIEANTLTGVKFGGYMNLKVFTVKVDGTINPGGSFVLKGAYVHNGQFIKANINVTVTQNGVALTGTGTVYGLLGNELASGNITFHPNWANGTLEACINGYCVNL